MSRVWRRARNQQSESHQFLKPFRRKSAGSKTLFRICRCPGVNSHQPYPNALCLPLQSAHLMLTRRPTAVGSNFCSIIILTKFWLLQRLVELAADQTKLVSQCLCQKRIVNSRETCTNPAIAMINGLITMLVAATAFASGQRCSSVPSAFWYILTGADLRMLFRPVDGWPMTDCHTHCIILAQG